MREKLLQLIGGPEREESDRFVVESVLSEYWRLSFDDAIVLDIGGHIGIFAEYAYLRGARRVFSVEPEPVNWSIHWRNMLDRPQHILLNAACTGDDRPVRELNINTGSSRAKHSLLPVFEPSAEPTRAQVAAVRFDSLLTFANPEVLKVDCEGAEYEFDWRLPSCVCRVAVEFHDVRRLEDEVSAILGKLKAQEFSVAQQSSSLPDFRTYILER